MKLLINYQVQEIFGSSIELDLNSHVTVITNPSGEGKTLLYNVLRDLKQLRLDGYDFNESNKILDSIELIDLQNFEAYPNFDALESKIMGLDQKLLFIDEFDLIYKLPGKTMKGITELLLSYQSNVIIVCKQVPRFCGYLDSSIVKLSINKPNGKFYFNQFLNNDLKTILVNLKSGNLVNDSR